MGQESIDNATSPERFPVCSQAARCSPRSPLPPTPAGGASGCSHRSIFHAPPPGTRVCSLLKILFAVRASEAALKIRHNKEEARGGISQRPLQWHQAGLGVRKNALRPDLRPSALDRKQPFFKTTARALIQATWWGEGA